MRGLASGSQRVTGALAGPAWLATPASCRGVQGQTWRWKIGRESWSLGVRGLLLIPAYSPCPVLTHGAGVFSWLALGCLQVWGGLALGDPLTGGVSAQRLTALLRVEGWEARPAAPGWGSVGKRAGSDAVRSCVTGGYGSEGPRDPGKTQEAGPAGKGARRITGWLRDSAQVGPGPHLEPSPHSSCHEHPCQHFLPPLRMA